MEWLCLAEVDRTWVEEPPVATAAAMLSVQALALAPSEILAPLACRQLYKAETWSFRCYCCWWSPM